ncbi:MAG: YceH family protein [Sphingobacterium sp.]
MEQTENLLPQLSDEEIRVLGSLIEKSRTTPEYYPMTLNGLQTACNQKTSRKPVVQYDESTIVQSLDSLRKRGLISTVVGGGSRVTKYKHNLAIKFPLLPQELVVIGLLFLRGPLTAGEINSISGRLYEYEGLEEVNEILEKLNSDTPRYLRPLAKGPGQKETRYVHLFKVFDETTVEDHSASELMAPNQKLRLEERVTKLEDELTALREEFDKLMRELS